MKIEIQSATVLFSKSTLYYATSVVVYVFLSLGWTFILFQILLTASFSRILAALFDSSL